MTAQKMLTRLGLFLMTALGTIVPFSLSTPAVQLADGTVWFVRPPRLLNAWNSRNEIRAWSATYYFTLELPENAGESLKQVTIVQKPSPDRIEFDLADSQVFMGERPNLGAPLAITATTDNPDSITLTLREPVAPGQKVTIALKPLENPDSPGTYLFGVTAFPDGQQAQGSFMGFGRLHFYGGGGDAF